MWPKIQGLLQDALEPQVTDFLGCAMSVRRAAKSEKADYMNDYAGPSNSVTSLSSTS